MDFRKQKHLWVDGICINQDDEPERGHQVAMMAGIYRTAATVLADVGEAVMSINLLHVQAIFDN